MTGMKMQKKEIFLRLWIVAAYFAMWYIYVYAMDVVRVSNMERYHMIRPFYLALGENINRIAIGLVIFLIPYEYIFTGVSGFVRAIIDLFVSGGMENAFKRRRYAEISVLLVVYVILVRYVSEAYWAYFSAQITLVTVLLSTIAVVIMYIVYDLISDCWNRYFVSCTFISILNTVFCYSISHRFVFSIITYVVVLSSWHIYDSLTNKRVSITKLLASLAATFLFFVLALNCTNHLQKWIECLDPFYGSDNWSSYMMAFLREEPFMNVEFANFMHYYSYPFIAINRYLGTPYLIAHLVLFVSAAIAAVVQISITAKKSVKRACVFASISLWFVCVYLYNFLCCAAMLPEASMPFINLYMDLPPMAIMFKVLWKGKRHDEVLVDWDELLGLKFEYDDEDDDLDDFMYGTGYCKDEDDEIELLKDILNCERGMLHEITRLKKRLGEVEDKLKKCDLSDPDKDEKKDFQDILSDDLQESLQDDLK